MHSIQKILLTLILLLPNYLVAQILSSSRDSHYPNLGTSGAGLTQESLAHDFFSFSFLFVPFSSHVFLINLGRPWVRDDQYLMSPVDTLCFISSVLLSVLNFPSPFTENMRNLYFLEAFLRWRMPCANLGSRKWTISEERTLHNGV